MQQLIDDLLVQAQVFLMDGRHELYRRTMDEVKRLKERQEKIRKEQHASDQGTVRAGS